MLLQEYVVVGMRVGEDILPIPIRLKGGQDKQCRYMGVTLLKYCYSIDPVAISYNKAIRLDCHPHVL